MFINRTGVFSTSWIGGAPFLPPGIDHPQNENLEPLTFFFTIAFPSNHPLSDLSLSFFFDTQHFNEDLTIPEMLPAHDSTPVVPPGFLHKYQGNFKTYLFPTQDGVVLNTEHLQIVRQNLAFSAAPEPDAFGYAGAEPIWVVGEEAPGMCQSANPVFAVQIFQDQAFPKFTNAPSQSEMNIFGGSKRRKDNDYFFFNQNEVYFFGYPTLPLCENVYIITQCD